MKHAALMLAVLVVAGALPALQTSAPADGAVQLDLGGADAVTASDAGGGYLTTRDIILIVVVVFAVIGLIAIL